jgi:hypothetical protein
MIGLLRFGGVTVRTGPAVIIGLSITKPATPRWLWDADLEIPSVQPLQPELEKTVLFVLSRRVIF